MCPLPSGIQQPFLSTVLGTKRQTKIEDVAAPFSPPDQGDSPASQVCIVTQAPFPPGIGNWTQLDASLPFDVSWIQMNFTSNSASQSALIDLELGTGAAASEVAWVDDIMVRFSNVGTEGIAGAVISMPCDPAVMASGERFSARVRDEVLTAQRGICIGWTLYGVTP